MQVEDSILLEEIPDTFNSPVLSANTRRRAKKVRRKSSASVKEKLFTFHRSPTHKCTIEEQCSQLNEPTALVHDVDTSNLPECENKDEFSFSFEEKHSKNTPPFNARKKKRHFLYPYRDVIGKPQSCILADDLLTLALDMELQTKASTTPAPNLSVPSTHSNSQQHTVTGLIAYSNLHREKMQCAAYEAGNSVVSARNSTSHRIQRCNAKRPTTPKNVSIDNFLFDCNPGGSMIRIIQMMLKGNVENDDEETARRVIQRLRRVIQFDVADIVQCVYSIYILTKRIHLGSMNEFSYRRNVVLGLVSSVEQTFPQSRFSLEFVASTFDRIKHDFHLFAEMGAPMRCVKVLYSNALARPLFTDASSRTSWRRGLSSESRHRTTVNSAHHDAIRSIERESSFSVARTMNDERERLGVRIENYGADCSSAAYSNFPGFKTGAGKSISVSTESLNMFKKKLLDTGDEYAFMLNDESFSIDKKKCDIKVETKSKSVSKGCYGGFKTGAGQLIDVSAESLQASEKIFSNVCDKYETFDDEFAVTSGGIHEHELEFASLPFGFETRLNVTPKEAHYGGFKTGAGKLINVRAESLEASKRAFFDVDDDCDTFSDRPNASLTIKLDSSFSIDENTSILAPSAVETEPNAEPKTWHGRGFKTGAGKLIDVRAESLNDSKIKCFHLQKKSNDELAGHPSPLHFTGAEQTITNRSVRKESQRRFTIMTPFPIAGAFALSECTPTNVVSDTNNGAFEAEPQGVHFEDVGECESSFDLSREITESTSAFLYDVSNDESCSFIPRTSDSDTTENTCIDSQQKPAVRASPSSPVLAGSFSRKARYAKKYRSPVLGSSALRSSPNETDDNIYLRRVCYTSTPVDTVLKSGKRKPASYPPHCTPTKKLKLSATPIATATATATASASDEQVMERRQRAAIAQQRYIDHKPSEFCKPFAGYYSTRVTNAAADQRISLKQLALGKKPKTFTMQQYIEFGLLPTVLQVTSRNAGHFVFTNEFISEELLKNGDCPVLFGDAAPILLNSRNEITLEEITRAFLASPGVDPKLVSRAWIANHYRWIVWKLASTERSFPYTFGRRYLTLNNVLFQLKFRYDREIDRCVGPALKRILEGDDTPAKPLVLCVAAIEKAPRSLTQQYNIELTDGWYGIFAQVDEQMNKLISRRKLIVGTKLIIAGAELVGWNQGRDPLNMDDGTRLKFSTNSCRRVRWYTRMGFYAGRVGPFCRINTLLPNGGLISNISAVVARVYPLLFLEKYQHRSGAAHVHNEKSENKRIAEYEKARLACVEAILPRITSEVLRENYSVTADSIQQLCSQEADFNNYNYKDRDKLRLIIQERIESRLPEKFSKKRNVSRLLKLRLVDPNDENLTSAILTIWNPSDDVIDFFKEDKTYNFYNLRTNGVRGDNLLLSSNRLSKYEECSPTKRLLSGCCRCVTRADELRAEKCSPAFGEVDMVGVVVKICWHEDRRLIYLTDLAGTFFAVSFRTDEKNFNYEDVTKRGKIIAGVNLQWKKGFLFRSIPVLFTSEYSFFVQSTRRQALQRSIDELGDHFKRNNLNQFIEECAQKLDSIIARLPRACTAISAVKSNDGNSLNVSAEPTIRDSVDQNSSSSGPVLTESFSRVKNPNRCPTLSRIEKLQNYGEPPPLPPVTLTSRLAVNNGLQVQGKTLK